MHLTVWQQKVYEWAKLKGWCDRYVSIPEQVALIHSDLDTGTFFVGLSGGTFGGPPGGAFGCPQGTVEAEDLPLMLAAIGRRIIKQS